MKASTAKLLVLAASLTAALVAGCAGLNDPSAASGASATTQSDIDTPGNPHSPYPAVTDAAIF